MLSDFVHLHVHTHYSLFDSTITCNGLLDMARKYKMSAVALTDHDTLSGVMDMYDTCTQAGVNLVVGCEIYLKSIYSEQPCHLVLLAKDIKGYHNLCALISTAHVRQTFVTNELLAQYSKGLIALSGCMKGQIPAAILRDDLGTAMDQISIYRSIFGKDSFYLELMDHGLECESKISQSLIKLSRRMNVPLVATNNVHYVAKEHAASCDVMFRIGADCKSKKYDCSSNYSNEFHFKSPEEMKELFKEVPEAIHNTCLIAECCRVEFKFPQKTDEYPAHIMHKDKEELRQICLNALKERYGFFYNTDLNALNSEQNRVIRRIEYELDIIEQAKYCRHYLIILGIVRFAMEKGIPVGPGRGKSVGSMVAYLCHITDIDPLKYDLRFECFINPDAPKLPRFEIDVCQRRYEELIQYINAKYGEDCVAKGSSCRTFKSKATVKSLAIALKRDYRETVPVTDLIPFAKGMTLKKAQAEVPALKMMVEQTPWIKEVFKHAEIIEGTNCIISSQYPIVISRQPIFRTMPLAKAENGDIFIEYSSDICEQLGLVKFNLGPFPAITFIQDIIDNIRKNHDVIINWSEIPLNDRPTFKLITMQDTAGIYGLECDEVQNLCGSFKPETITDLMLILAMAFDDSIPQIISRKNRAEPVIYECDAIRDILSSTYGFIVYVEQGIRILHETAGFTYAKGALLASNIVDDETIAAEQIKSEFINGCRKSKLFDHNAEIPLWNKLIAAFKHGTSKAHYVAYAVITYRTAYLKTHYRAEFMSAYCSRIL